MKLKLSEKQFNNILKKNSNLKIANIFRDKNAIQLKPSKTKIPLKNKKDFSKIPDFNENEINKIKPNKTKYTQVNVSEINKLNKNAICISTVSDKHLSFLFVGAKLLSVNQIFAILQYRKYEIYSYKKNWHEIIKNNLNIQHYKLKSQGKSLPYFDTSVEITLFRQAKRLVDEDAMTTMFKYIIDGLKRDPKKNPNGVLAEDNPKIVHRIICYSEKGEPAIGIKIKKIEEKKKEFSAEDILVE